MEYEWNNGTVGEQAMEAARAGRLDAKRQSDVVLALIGLADARRETVEAESGAGAYRQDEYCQGARAALLGVIQMEPAA